MSSQYFEDKALKLRPGKIGKAQRLHLANVASLPPNIERPVRGQRKVLHAMINAQGYAHAERRYMSNQLEKWPGK